MSYTLQHVVQQKWAMNVNIQLSSMILFFKKSVHCKQKIIWNGDQEDQLRLLGYILTLEWLHTDWVIGKILLLIENNDGTAIN